MKTAMLLVLWALPLGVAHGAEPPVALTQYRCYLCHSDYETRAGPAYADVAARYRGKRGARDAIADVIRGGLSTGGPWHMPPHPEVSVQDAREMARYILSLPPLPEPMKGAASTR